MKVWGLGFRFLTSSTALLACMQRRDAKLTYLLTAQSHTYMYTYLIKVSMDNRICIHVCMYVITYVHTYICI
jgi:hypothetical protein